jgi:glycosyltransferase involved in cell wall biosynthesis
MDTRISVIVPVYNAERFLMQCIESILSQSLEEIELLLVDDGSTDKSGEICEVYARRDGRIRVFHQKNEGPIAARKKGLEESCCEYVTFADADDFVAVDSYVLALPDMQSGTDMVLFGITRYIDPENQSTEYINREEGLYDRKQIEERIFPDMIWDREKGHFGIDPSLCTKIVKRDLALSAYDTLQNSGFHYGEDMAVVYTMLKKADRIAVRRNSYYYHRMRKRDEAPGYIADEKYFDKLYLLYRQMCRQFDKDAGLRRQIESFYMYSVGLRGWVYGEYGTRLRYLFPFDKVEKGGRIILYGAGIVGHAYREQLCRIDYCSVVLWVDRNSRGFAGEGVVEVERIRDTEFDQIVLAIESTEIRNTIKKALEGMGIAAVKIVY